MTSPTRMDISKFWKHIFEEEGLALRMSEVAGNSDGISFDSSIYKRVELTAAPASVLGDNFLSVVYLAQAVLEDGTIYRSFVKTMPSITMLHISVLDSKIFGREAAIYNHFLSELRQIRAEVGLSEDELPLNVPELYYAHLDESGGCLVNKSVLIMEDLKNLGFRMVDKRMGCTKAEAKIALSTLARYHALSIAAVKKWKLPDGSLALSEPLSFIPAGLTAFDNQIQPMLDMYLPLQIRMLKELGHEEVALWLEEESSAAGKALTQQDLDDCGPLGCIIHADCWNNNMLYRYSEDGKPVEMKLIDWQITRLGHPGTDVVHFLFSSTQPELLFKEGCILELLNHYYDILSSSLEKLGLIEIVRQRNRQQFIEEVKGRFRFGMFLALVLLPGVLDDSGLMQEIEEKDAKEKMENETVNVEEKMEEFKEMMTLDRLLSNKLLCQRVINLVEGVKANLTYSSVEFRLKLIVPCFH